MEEKRLINEFDQLIRQGRQGEVWAQLRLLKPAQISRNYLPQFSDLARRIQQPLLSFQFLGRTIKNHYENIEKARPEEIISYCHSLIKLGFFRETQSLLSQVDENQYPQVYDLMARLYARQWNYHLSTPLFRKYVENMDPQSYAYMVGSLNLADSLLNSGRLDSAIFRLEKLADLAKKSDNQLILGNCHELAAQAYIEIEDYEMASAHLKEGYATLGKSSSIWSFYVKKWNFFIQHLKHPNSQTLIPRGKELMLEAQSKGYFEEVRDIERRLATLTLNKSGVLKVYFGTHYKSYRSLILKKYPQSINIPKNLNISLFGDGGSDFDPEIELMGHPALIRLFHTLTSDLYSPLSLGHIFDSIYNEQYFDPDHTPIRIYSLVKRLRSKIEKTHEMGIHWGKDGVRIFGNKPVKIQVGDPIDRSSPKEKAIKALKKQVQKKWFTRSQASSILNLSSSSTRSVLSLAGKNKKIMTEGSGRSIRYRFK